MLADWASSVAVSSSSCTGVLPGGAMRISFRLDSAIMDRHYCSASTGGLLCLLSSPWRPLPLGHLDPKTYTGAALAGSPPPSASCHVNCLGIKLLLLARCRICGLALCWGSRRRRWGWRSSALGRFVEVSTGGATWYRVPPASPG